MISVATLKIIISSLGIALWYNATGRLYDLLIPHVDWVTTLLMFVLATLILIYDNGKLDELTPQCSSVASIVSSKPHVSAKKVLTSKSHRS